MHASMRGPGYDSDNGSIQSVIRRHTRDPECGYVQSVIRRHTAPLFARCWIRSRLRIYSERDTETHSWSRMWIHSKRDTETHCAVVREVLDTIPITDPFRA